MRATAESRRPLVGAVARGPDTGKLQFPVRVPVVRAGAARYVVTAVITASAIQQLLEEQRLPPEWVGAIIDARGVVAARTRAADQFVGQPAAALMPPPRMPAAGGWVEGAMVDGSRSYVTYARSPLSAWTVALAVPVDVVDGPLRRSLWSVAGAGLLFTLAGAVAAMLVGRRIARPLVTLSTAAEALGRGESPLIPPTPVVEVDQVGGAFAAAAAQRAQAEGALRESEARFRAIADEAESRRWEAEVIARLARTVDASLDSDTVLQAVADSAKEVVACELTRIALWDETGEAMVYRYTVGTRYTGYADTRLTPGKGLVGGHRPFGPNPGHCAHRARARRRPRARAGRRLSALSHQAGRSRRARFDRSCAGHRRHAIGFPSQRALSEHPRTAGACPFSLWSVGFAACGRGTSCRSTSRPTPARRWCRWPRCVR